MLSPADADLVQRERRIAGLAILLDPDEFTATLRQALPRVDLGDARPTYVRYKPGTNCLVAYQVPAGGQELDVHAMAFGDGADRKLRKVGERKSISGPVGPGIILPENRAIAIFVFPNDSKLNGLLSFASRETERGLLSELLPARPDLWEGTPQRIAYKPERRFVARLMVGTQPKAVLKVYTRSDYLTAERNACAFSSRGPLRVALRLGRSKRHNVLAFDWLEGRLLSETLQQSLLDLRPAKVSGRAIAELHAQSVARLTPLARDREAADLVAVAVGLGHVCPDFTGRARRLAESLAASLADEVPMNRSIHGDFYAKQVLIAGGTAAILDLDRAASGDPSADLGLFIAHLERAVLRGSLHATRLEPVKNAFLEGYQSVAHDYAPERLELYTAVGLLRLAPDPFRHRDPDWPRATEAILERAEAILGTIPGRTFPYTPQATADSGSTHGG